MPLLINGTKSMLTPEESVEQAIFYGFFFVVFIGTFAWDMIRMWRGGRRAPVSAPPVSTPPVSVVHVTVTPVETVPEPALPVRFQPEPFDETVIELIT